MVMYAKIRRMYYREHLSINEIQRRTSLSRNTIKKWLKAPNDSAVKYQRAKKPGKLTLFESRLLLALEADARRPKKDRRTALMLFKEILNEGYTGGYSIVCDFIREWRNQGSQSKSVYVPLRFTLGEAFQFDWSEEWLVIGGITARCWQHTPSYALVELSCCRVIHHKATRCCLKLILVHSQRLAVCRNVAFTTT